MPRIYFYKTLLKLGIINIIRVGLYRFFVKIKHYKEKPNYYFKVEKKYFNRIKPYQLKNISFNTMWDNSHGYFGIKYPSDKLPIWNKNFFTQKISLNTSPWTEISDFDNESGDIKGIWEASRFDWVITFAQKAAMGDNNSVEKLNNWLCDWLNNNLPYYGVNWKCGQEASIRVIHLALASFILNQTKNSRKELLEIIKFHLERIDETKGYAKAQDNNHGTSEAAALFIGGSWLYLNKYNSGIKYMKSGRKMLENRVRVLISNDGSFSQQSTNYHRLMLDTLSISELWRSKHNLDFFSDNFYFKSCAATNWMYQFIATSKGDVPNLGANDGAQIIPLTSSDFRDFRPCIQLASNLFLKSSAYSNKGEFDDVLTWLGLEKSNAKLPIQESIHFQDGGYILLRENKNRTLVALRYPKFNFRPSQCDVLNIDLWHEDTNLISDAGTYSYNAPKELLEYFSGTESHNTIQFDYRDQMPRISRFLFGDWLSTNSTDFDYTKNYASSSYKDRHGSFHKRDVKLNKKYLKITDHISGFNIKAVSRFRLPNKKWFIKGNIVISEDGERLEVLSESKYKIFLNEGSNSRYYFRKEKVCVLELVIFSPGRIIIKFMF